MSFINDIASHHVNIDVEKSNVDFDAETEKKTFEWTLKLNELKVMKIKLITRKYQFTFICVSISTLNI